MQSHSHSANAGAHEPRHDNVHFEHSDIHARGVMLVGLGVLLTVWCSLVFLHFFYRHVAHHADLTSPAPLPSATHGRPLPPEPRLQVSPTADWQDMKSAEDTALSTYHWVDRDRGLVSIPIDEAMRITAQQGIPAQPAPQGFTYYTPLAGDRNTGFDARDQVEPR